ncbi:MAG: (Fe-S)-binding protein [Prevotellaceae bacterium]|jgi:Fe-S oxidoreductase|nr:(Fe-S)-binding protein [Prevotellaceae bacterium]
MQERLSYDPFVLPFTFGMVYIIVYLIVAMARVINALPKEDKQRLAKGIFSKKIFISIKEIFLECLIHRKIFKHNKWLGFMHMSIAFGWFMMILLAHIEVKLYAPTRFNLPYYPIFFRYFMMETETTLRGGLLFFLMDFFLLLTLTGVGMAMYKRINKRRFGMRRTTRLRLGDTIAMYTLWAIFPLRLLAESFTSNVSGGSFLTRGFGLVFENFVSNPDHTLPIWWAYSIALGIFMVALPHSRFMHIPTEMLLIVLRNSGIKVEKKNKGIATISIYSCSRCGMCLDPCQMVSAARLNNRASVYFLRQVRHKEKETENTANACLMCGRCVQACPVGIDSCAIKQNVRDQRSLPTGTEQQYSYLPQPIASEIKPEILYFAGCMTHLTPGIKQSMEAIFKHANVNYQFMDEKGSICCGRPLLLAGQTAAGERLIETNKKIIAESGAKILVTSCPICYRAFNETYNLPIKVLHHTEYLERLIDEGRIKPQKSLKNFVYHDSCELSRYSNIYKQPRNVLRSIAYLQPTPYDGKDGICCGGSIGSTLLTSTQRRKIAIDAANKLTEKQPDCLVTSCPLCKKTFDNTTATDVKDIAQVVKEALIIE